MASKWKKDLPKLQKLIDSGDFDSPRKLAMFYLKTDTFTHEVDLLRTYIGRQAKKGVLKGIYGGPKKQRKRLYYDIETSPNVGYFWRPGGRVRISHDNILEERKIICICWKWEDDPKVYSLDWGAHQQDDKILLGQFIEIMEEATEIVAHNGDNFDERWIRGRALYHRIPMRHKYRSIDTYKKAKSVFNLNSYKLDYIADFLGYGNKLNVEFGLWKEVMKNDEKALQDMVEYCKHDVRLLELVHSDIKNYVIHNTNYAVLNNKDKYDCPECSSSNVRHSSSYTTSTGTIKAQMECNDCGKYYVISNKTFMTLLADKQLGTIIG